MTSSAEGSVVSVTFDLTPEEWVEVAWEHNHRSPLYRKTLRDLRVVFALIVALLALLMLVVGEPFLSVVWLFLGGLATVAFPRFLERSQRRQYRRFAHDGIANGMFGTHRVQLLDEGLLDETDAYQRITRWHAIERVEEGQGAFLIYMGRNAFLPVPHSAFPDSATLRSFADRFYECVGHGRPGAKELGASPRDQD